MFTIKVPLKFAEKVKKYLAQNSLVDFSRKVAKDSKNVFFPVKKKEKIKEKFPEIEFVKKDLNKRIKKITNLKDALRDILTEKEFESLKRAFDVVGSIAVLEIDDSLKKKEKKIAKALLDMHKNIKTVVKKADIHKGLFRTQKMKHLAGEKTLETVHKELNTKIKLNVEDVYFSARSGTERKRIAEKVKKGETVLVMFSGCAPFVCSIAKNSKPEYVYGIEINPKAHKYGIENLKLNKIHNALLLNGDVRKIVPDFYSNIVGLKSDDGQKELKQRLVMHPHIMELHTWTEDLFSKKAKLEKVIKDLKEKGIKVIIHMPFSNKAGARYSLDVENPKEFLEVLAILGELCIKYDVKAIVHPVQNLPSKNTCSEKTLVSNLKKLKKYFDHFYFENVFEQDCLFSRTEDIKRVAKKAGVRGLCVDLCHLYLYYKSNKKIIDHINALKDDFNLYFHLADSDGKKHGIEIGTGKIDFKKILPLVRVGIAEVTSKDELHPIEQLHSYKKITSKHKTFDRIVMPLPKSAETFLDTAFKASKKGTIIHLYVFLSEPDLKKQAKDLVEKVAKKCKTKVKVMDVVKCGQYSPKTFRVCIDIKVL